MCRLRIPLGHPASKCFEADGSAFEIEHEREFVAGPGITAPRAIDPSNGEETIIGANLLPVGENNPPVHVGASNLGSFMRRAAKRFDTEAVAVNERAARAGKDAKSPTIDPSHRTGTQDDQRIHGVMLGADERR